MPAYGSYRPDRSFAVWAPTHVRTMEDAMDTTTLYRCISWSAVTAALVLNALPAYSQSGSGSGSGSEGTSSGGSIGAAKPGNSQTAGKPMQGIDRLSQTPNQTQAERAKALEER